MAFLEEYTMLDELGRGGFATVYKVRHNELGYIRAVRVLNETVVGAGSKAYQNFLRECKTLLRLGNGNHPNIVHIYQPRLLESRALVEMDYVDGLNVFEYLEQNHNYVPVEEVIRMAVQISSALSYCHEDIYKFCMDRGEDNLIDDPNDGSRVLMDEATHKRLIEKYKVIHNDIHSGNIMRRGDGNYILLDFGLAINGDEVVRVSSSRRANGAPEFKAPEKWNDESVLSEQTDIYSFGIVLFQCLAGRVPFPFDINRSNRIEAEYMLSKAHKEVVPPSIETLRKEYYEKKYEGQKYTRDYPQWLEDVILKCLNKKPEDRFRNGRELQEVLMKNIEFEKESDICGKLEEQTVVVKRLSNENEILNDQLREKQEKNTVLQQSLQEAKNKIVYLQKEKDALSLENINLSDNNRIVEDALKEKQSIINQLKESMQNVQDEKIKMEDERNELLQEIYRLRETNKTLNGMVNEKQNVIMKQEQLMQNQGVKENEEFNRGPSTVILCKKCGTCMPVTAKFCRKCGFKLK